jgi:methionine-rich copper-binding protein CopC
MSLTRRMFPLIVALCLAFAAARPAYAHALVIESSPAAGSSIAGPRIDVALRFNSRLDHRRSRLALVAQDGAEHPLALAEGSAPDILQATAADVAPGAYKLRWLVLAIDGHITRGDIPFHVTQP